MKQDTNFNYVLIEVVLLLLVQKIARSDRLLPIFSSITALMAVLAVVGHMFSVSLIGVLTTDTTSMALPATFTFMALDIGIMFTHQRGN